ncbi:MAG: phosphoribosyl-ATP diphosphatase [Spirochaetales bacterium]|nr:phosphoribosyl-ATP diphosphatase [Spirochaetales bacterium]
MELVHKILPLVIKDRQGQILEVSLSNEKGFKKSLERGQLWHLHKETGRLLPYSEESMLNISEHTSWYEAILSIGKEHSPLHDQGDLFKTEEDDIKINGNKGILELLQEVLLKRKRDLPEGSYTTHLFQSGAEKIRKKTGEEAIELILASSRSEIIYESADLVYHMLVLLLSEDISIEEVLAELGKRAAQG